MLKLERSVISSVARRFRSRAAVELENLALRHQLRVLRRQRPGRLRLFTFDLCGELLIFHSNQQFATHNRRVVLDCLSRDRDGGWYLPPSLQRARVKLSNLLRAPRQVETGFDTADT